MAKYFSDIAKGVKDVLTGGLSYDNKLSISHKGLKADVTSKGTNISGSATANVTIDEGFTGEITVNESGDVKGNVAHSGIVDGLKTTISGEPMNLNKTLKIANTLLNGDVGIKTDVSGVLTTPKVDTSVCYNMGDAQVGAEATVCSVKGVTAYTLAAQTKMDDATVAVILADKLDTVKLSAVAKLEGATTAAAEAIYKIKSGDLKLNAGAATKLDNGHAVKVVLSSAGTVSSSYSGEVAKGVTGTACLQVDQQMKYKYGFQIAAKQ